MAHIKKRSLKINKYSLYGRFQASEVKSLICARQLQHIPKAACVLPWVLFSFPAEQQTEETENLEGKVGSLNKKNNKQTLKTLVSQWKSQQTDQKPNANTKLPQSLWNSQPKFGQAPAGGQRGQWHPTPVLLPGKSHGWRSLGGCSPWGCWESGTTEWLRFQFSLSCIGEGNGNPLQCSCLENPRDGEAWWAAVYGVAQSQTRLRRLSSSSSCWGYPAEHSQDCSCPPGTGVRCASQVWGPQHRDLF